MLYSKKRIFGPLFNFQRNRFSVILVGTCSVGPPYDFFVDPWISQDTNLLYLEYQKRDLCQQPKPWIWNLLQHPPHHLHQNFMIPQLKTSVHFHLLSTYVKPALNLKYVIQVIHLWLVLRISYCCSMHSYFSSTICTGTDAFPNDEYSGEMTYQGVKYKITYI